MATRLFRALMLCAVLSLALTNAFAQNSPKYWSGPYNGDWNVAANWTPPGVPGLNNDVTIYTTGGDYVHLINSGLAEVGTLTIGGGGQLQLSELYSNGGQQLAIDDYLVINQSGKLTLQAGDIVQVGNGFPGLFLNRGYLYVGPGAQMIIGDDTTGAVVAGSSFIIRGWLTPEYLYLLDTIEAGGTLALENGLSGTGWVIAPPGNLGTLTNSGVLLVDKGTTLNVNGSVVNNGLLATGSIGGNNTLDIYGGLTNNGQFHVGGGDTANLNYLVNNSDVVVAQGGTLSLLNNDGIPNIPANSSFQIYGTFTQAYYSGNPSAFYNLTTDSGSLSLYNGQATNIAPISGTLTNSGFLVIAAGSTVNINGALTNSGGTSAFGVFDAGTVVNVGSLDNNGLTYVGPGATLNLTNQPNGITDVVAGSTFDIAGTFNARHSYSGFNSLTFIEGTVMISNGQKIQDNPTETQALPLLLPAEGH